MAVKVGQKLPARHTYAQRDCDEAVALCLSCSRAKCPGLCDAVTRLNAANDYDRQLELAKKREAKGLKPRGQGALYTVDGVADTLSGWSKRTGIKLITLHSRVYRKGMSMAEAISYKKHKGIGHTPVTIEGETHIVYEWLRITGKTLGGVNWRIRHLGETVEQATIHFYREWQVKKVTL